MGIAFVYADWNIARRLPSQGGRLSILPLVPLVILTEAALFSNESGDIGGVSREICFSGLEGVEEKDFCSNAETRENLRKLCRFQT